MYLPECFPPRAECRCHVRFPCGICTFKRTAPCSEITAYFVVSCAAAWDVSWNRSPESSGGDHAQQRPARTDPSLVLRRTFESRHHRAATRVAPGHRPPCAGYRAGAEVTGLSLRFLYYAIQQKDLPTIRVGCCRLITEKALQEWLERKAEATAETKG